MDYDNFIPNQNYFLFPSTPTSGFTLLLAQASLTEESNQKSLLGIHH